VTSFILNELRRPDSAGPSARDLRLRVRARLGAPHRTGNKKVTGKAAASKAAKTLSSKSASKQAKSAAGSALTQKPRKRR
jgi:hypothetical protein